MFKKMRKWFTPKLKSKIGRPKLAKKGVLKAAKIELVMAFLLCATFALAGTSTLTGRSPLELLSFGLASKASGGTYSVPSKTYNLVCNNKQIGTYTIQNYTTNNNQGNGGISFSGGTSQWVGEQYLNAEIISGSRGKLIKARWSLYTSDTATKQCEGIFKIITNTYETVKVKIVIGRDQNNNIIKGTALYSTMYVSGRYKNKNTNKEYDTDSDHENIRVDRAAPIVKTLNVYMDSYFRIVSTVGDPGEGRGHMVFNIYNYSLKTGAATGAYIISKSEMYNNKTDDERKSFYWSTLGKAGYYILKAGIIDDVGNKGVGKEVCFKSTSGLSVSNGTVTEIPCGTKYSLNIKDGVKWVSVNPDATAKYKLIAVANLNQTIKWVSSNPAVVKIEASKCTAGTSTVAFSAKSLGEATLTATTDTGLKKVVTIYVVAPITISVNPTSKTTTKGKEFFIKATITPAGKTATWKSSNTNIVKIIATSADTKLIKVKALGVGKANITATTFDNQVVTIPVTVQAAGSGTTSETATTQPGTQRTNTTKVTSSVTSKKQVDVSEIVGGVVITITPDPATPYTTVKYGKVAKMITTFTRTPSTLPARYRQWYTYYKDRASDKWVLNWGTKDSTTGQVAPCTLVKDTVGASPTLSMNHKYRVGKWLIFSDSKCTKNLGSVLTPVYTAY